MDGLRILPYSRVEPHIWDHFVRTSPDGWVFAISPWQRLILGVERWQLSDQSFAIFDDGRLVTAMPLHHSAFTTRTTSGGWGGSGPILAPDLNQTDRQRFHDFAIAHAKTLARKNKSPILDYWVSPVTPSSLRAELCANAEASVSDLSILSQVIDLSPDEPSLYEGMTSDARRTIKRAQESGVVARLVRWIEHLDSYYDVHTETYARTSTPPHPRSYFAGIATEMAPLGYSTLFAAYKGDDVIGYMNIAKFENGALYHTGCSKPAALEHGANYLLMWEAIRWCKINGARWFDVGAVFPEVKEGKQHGLTVFKSKFGGERRKFYRCEIQV